MKSLPHTKNPQRLTDTTNKVPDEKALFTQQPSYELNGSGKMKVSTIIIITQ